MEKFQKDDILARLVAAEADFCAAPKKAEASLRSCDHWARPVLLERTAYLRKLARFSEGSASDLLGEYDGHRAELSIQLRSGPPVLHEGFATLLVVVEGRATLVSGGTLMKPKQVGRGEFTGAAIEDGSTEELRAGDVAHIAAGTPYRLLLSGEASLACLVLRIAHSDRNATSGLTSEARRAGT